MALKDIVRDVVKMELAKKTAKAKGWDEPEKLSLKEGYKARRAELTAEARAFRNGDFKASRKGKRFLSKNKALSDKEIADILLSKEIGSKRGRKQEKKYPW